MILGTVQFGLNYGINNSTGQPTENLCNEILLYAHNQGIRVLDTAPSYGNSESVIGAFHRKYNLYFDVCTKLPVSLSENIQIARRQINDSILNSLKTLNVEQLYCCYFHRFEQFKNLDLLRILNEYKTKSIVKNTGVSIYYPEELEYILNNDDHFIDIVQIPLNIMSLNKWEQLIIKAKSKGIRIFVRSMYLQGLVFAGSESIKVKALSAEKYIKFIEELARSKGASIATLCYKVLTENACIDDILVGSETLEQIKENVRLKDELIDLSYED